MSAKPLYCGIIPPEAVAYKLAAWQNFKTPKFAAQVEALPRLPEVIWMLQWQSMQPGGLAKFVEQFLAAFPERLATPAMHRLGNAAYTAADRAAIMAEIPRDGQSRSEFWARAEIGGSFYEAGRPNLAFISRLTPGDFKELCREVALTHLARHLHAFCAPSLNPKEDVKERMQQNDESEGYNSGWAKEDLALADVWYFHDLPGALIAMLDIHADRAQGEIVMTEVARQCFDALDYAWSEKAMVSIEGNTRFGKTQAVRTKCKMRPGAFRLARTPCSNGDYDLLQAVAESLGMEISLKTTYRELKARVEFIIRHGGLMFVLDEAHFLIPSRFSKHTPPMRLNWIRTRIVDQGCPLVLVTTPQDFKHCLDSFIRATGHNINQFLGRTLLNVRLPADLADADLLAVAKKHFPDLDDDYLDLIAGKEMQSESYLMAVEAIARRARYTARRDGRETLSLADVQSAIAEVIPATAAIPRPPAVTAAAPAQRKNPIAVRRTRATKPVAEIVNHGLHTERQAAPAQPKNPIAVRRTRATKPAAEMTTIVATDRQAAPDRVGGEGGRLGTLPMGNKVTNERQSPLEMPARTEKNSSHHRETNLIPQSI